MSDLDLSKPVRRRKDGVVVDILYMSMGWPESDTYEPVGYWPDSTHDNDPCVKVGWRNDLENIPQKRSGWVNIYTRVIPKERTDGRHVNDQEVFQTEKEAQRAGRGYGDYVATAHIEWEE